MLLCFKNNLLSCEALMQFDAICRTKQRQNVHYRNVDMIINKKKKSGSGDPC